MKRCLEGPTSAVLLAQAGGIVRRVRRALVRHRTLLVFLVLPLGFSARTAVSQPLAWDGGISGVLLVGQFRTQQQLRGMSHEDRRNTLIAELAGRTRDTVGQYQALNDSDLAGAGSLLAYLRGTGSRTDPQFKTMSADDMRNTVIVEVRTQTGRNDLQALSNRELIQLVLGRDSYLRGVMLVGVIVEVGAQTGRGADLQALSNMALVKLVLERPTTWLR
jgi:hypothetical protein